MSYYAEQGNYQLPLDARPLSTGATEPTTFAGKAKGWLTMLGIVAVALVAIKLTGKKKRKNPKRSVPARAKRRQAKLAHARTRASRRKDEKPRYSIFFKTRLGGRTKMKTAYGKSEAKAIRDKLDRIRSVTYLSMHPYDSEVARRKRGAIIGARKRRKISRRRRRRK